uniref:Carboxylic ester hydrolase n=2 Tax=Mesocestoides corti TaxID=53468 RepID=A0A5K3FWS6_MESCO
MLLFLLISVVLVKTAEVRSGDALLTLRSGVSLKGTKWTVDGVEVDAYLGIPFAKPPIGDLRFAPPVEARLWKGERDATQRPNTCWQYLFSGFDLANPAARVWINNTGMSEDCLYLNVWVPANMPQDGKPLPVMVWIFGGGFFSGTSTLDVYDGKFLAAKEGVIVVSMQYRLGPFGFLYVDSEVDGNMGLLDQRLALKWVQKHIAKFGGDPTKVTLFGESAGAASVTLQYLSPESRPLFQRMILQSASALNRWALSTKSVAHDAGLAFIKTSNCFKNGKNLKRAVKCLKKLPAETLFDRLYELSVASTARRQKRLSSLSPAQWPATFLTSAAQYFEVIMRPVLDGKFLPDCPTTLLKSIQEGQAPEALVGNV